MNYLLHYNVSFSLMKFSSSKMNRKARVGPHSMLQERLREARCGERKEIWSRGQAEAFCPGDCVWDPGCPQELSSESCIRNAGQLAAFQGRLEQTSRSIWGQAGQALKSPVKWPLDVPVWDSVPTSWKRSFRSLRLFILKSPPGKESLHEASETWQDSLAVP